MAEAEKYNEFSFASHKGYGTAKHIEEIKKHGLSPLHRKSFCGKFTGEVSSGLFWSV